MPVSIIAKFLGWTGLPQWLLEFIAVAVLVFAIWLSGVFHEKAHVEVRTIKEQVQVEKRIVATDHSHDQELADLGAYRAAHPLEPVRLCIDRVPPRPIEGRPRAAATDLQSVPAGDPGVRPPAAGPDIEPMLDLLAGRADEVSAGLRRRQTLEP